MRFSNFRFLFVFLFSSLLFSGYAQVKSPQDFLPHAYGQEFTPHHRLIDYYYHVAEQSPLVHVFEYGRTNQNRPLIYAIVTSESNYKKLETIRKNNLRRAGIINGAVNQAEKKSITWLSFGVHGNEAGASESSMMALYALASGTNGSDKNWLENTVVIIDPSVNPDGFNRYTNWNINTTGKHKNTDYDDNEHKEPWPSGRVNHYYHDLNRDWAWATQIETQQRLKVYHKWLPHIHADFHEMFPESPYYFAPAAEPLHKYISDWQREFQMDVGRNHASHFDKNNWLYYTREQFDLFYPSYGDTYPMFNGAIGMTYEQAGHGIAGRAIKIKNGETLTLQDRIDHHLTTALSTVEVAAKNSAKICEKFEAYYSNAISAPKGKYKSYIIKNSNSNDVSELLNLFDLHGITYGHPKSNGTARGFVFPILKKQTMDYKTSDFVIPVKQPHGVMVQVLLEPKSQLSDSLTYDITAWSLLAAYGLEAIATTREVSLGQVSKEKKTVHTLQKSYAYAIPYNGWPSALLMSKLSSQQVTCRAAQKSFSNSGNKFNKGTIIITSTDNKEIELLDVLTQLNINEDVKIHELKTGFSDSGPDVGSDEMKLIATPKILIVGGKGTNQYNYGQIWHLLDAEMNLPYTSVLETNFANISLNKYNTIILPQGNYPNMNKSQKTKLFNWVERGGKIIAFGNALRALAYEKGFSFKLKKEELTNEPLTTDSYDHQHKLERYETSFRSQVSSWMPGAIVRLEIDDSHPLGFGLGKHYASLKLTSMVIPYQEDTWNVGYIGDELVHLGFIGNKVKAQLKNSNSFFVKNQGEGYVIGLVDNPLYRSFWKKGRQVFFNALFMVQ